MAAYFNLLSVNSVCWIAYNCPQRTEPSKLVWTNMIIYTCIWIHTELYPYKNDNTSQTLNSHVVNLYISDKMFS